MGRWLSSIRVEASEKNESAKKIQKRPHTEHSKPSKPTQERVLKVSKVPHVSISEKFSPQLAAGLNAKNQEKPYLTNSQN